MQDEWDFGDLGGEKKEVSSSNQFDDWDLDNETISKPIKHIRKSPKKKYKYQKPEPIEKNDWDDVDEDDWDMDDPDPSSKTRDDNNRKFCQNKVMGYNSRAEGQQGKGTKIKCVNPYITVKEKGFVNGFERIGCSNLICRDCGIRIIKIEDYVWDESMTNYLFFRTNFGDKQRLQKGLISTHNGAAFSCGCKGKSVKQGGERLESSFGWKCTGCYH